MMSHLKLKSSSEKKASICTGLTTCNLIDDYAQGRYAFIGAGAVVTRDVPDQALFIGNSARQAGWFYLCGEKLDDGLSCSTCTRRHRKHMSGLEQIVEK